MPLRGPRGQKVLQLVFGEKDAKSHEEKTNAATGPRETPCPPWLKGLAVELSPNDAKAKKAKTNVPMSYHKNNDPPNRRYPVEALRRLD